MRKLPALASAATVAIAGFLAVPTASAVNVTEAESMPATCASATGDASGAAGQTATTVTAEVPSAIAPRTEVAAPVTVSPAANGTVSAEIDGRTITADVEDGAGSLPLVFPRRGVYEVPVTFTPAEGSSASAATTCLTVAVGESDYSSVTVAVNGPENTVTGKKLNYRALVTPDAGERRDVLGYVTLTSNGETVERDGEELRIPVSQGVAKFQLSWDEAGDHVIVATFHRVTGEELASGTKNVRVSQRVRGAGDEAEDAEVTESTEDEAESAEDGEFSTLTTEDDSDDSATSDEDKDKEDDGGRDDSSDDDGGRDSDNDDDGGRDSDNDDDGGRDSSEKIADQA